MLKIVLPEVEYYDDVKNIFYKAGGGVVTLEHSLLSISRWESKWKKPFLTKDQKSREESIDYIRCMSLARDLPPEILGNITDEVIEKVNEYIYDPMSATWFSENDGTPNREIITSEIIYYWMIEMGIPFECEKWHLNRLMTLITVCDRKRSPKKMTASEVMAKNKELNESRRQKLGSKG